MSAGWCQRAICSLYKPLARFAEGLDWDRTKQGSVWRSWRHSCPQAMFPTAAVLVNNRSPEVKQLTNHTFYPRKANRDLKVAGLHPSGVQCSNQGLKSAKKLLFFFHPAPNITIVAKFLFCSTVWNELWQEQFNNPLSITTWSGRGYASETQSSLKSQQTDPFFCWPHIDLPSKEKKYDPVEGLGLIWTAHRPDTLPHHYSKLQGKKRQEEAFCFCLHLYKQEWRLIKEECLVHMRGEKYHSHQTSCCHV